MNAKNSTINWRRKFCNLWDRVTCIVHLCLIPDGIFICYQLTVVSHKSLIIFHTLIGSSIKTTVGCWLAVGSKTLAKCHAITFFVLSSSGIRFLGPAGARHRAMLLGQLQPRVGVQSDARCNWQHLHVRLLHRRPGVVPEAKLLEPISNEGLALPGISRNFLGSQGKIYKRVFVALRD